MNRSMRLGPLPVVAMLALGLCACAGSPRPVSAGATSEEPNPIAVSLVKLSHEVIFAGSEIEPSAAEQSELDAFLAGSDARRGDTVTVLAGGGAQDEARTSALAAQLQARGFSGKVAHDAAVPTGRVRVLVERYVASAQACPDWSKAEWSNFGNVTSSNFGCSTSANLAAMVADPHDLVTGRPMGPAVGEAATRPVEVYRSGVVIPTGAGSSAGGGGGAGAPAASGP
jgi:pilus assembly protein CpaD